MAIILVQNGVYAGPAAELPATPPSNWAEGTQFFASDSTLTARVQVVAGVSQFVYGSSGGALPAGQGTVYVDPIAGSDSNPGTAAAPVATVQAGLQRAPSFAGALGCVVLLLSSAALGAGPQAAPSKLPNGMPVILRGAVTIQNGTRTGAAGGTTGSLTPTPTGGTVVDSVGGFGVNAYANMVVRFLTGPLAGVRAIILSNTATTLTCDAVFASAPVATSTWQIESQTAHLSWTPGTATNSATGLTIIGGAPIVFDSLYLNFDVGLLAWVYGNTQWNACQFVATGANGSLLLQSGFHDIGGNSLSSDVNGYAACGNSFTKVGVEAGADAGANISKTAFNTATVDAIQRASIFMLFCACTGVSVASFGELEDHNSISVTPGNATTFAFRCDFGGVLVLDTLDCSSFGAGSPPIGCLNNSLLTLRKVTGTANLAAVAVRIDQQSTLECKDAQTGTTITAATTDMEVGTTTSSWAALLAGVSLADAASQSYATTS